MAGFFGCGRCCWDGSVISEVLEKITQEIYVNLIVSYRRCYYDLWMWDRGNHVGLR